MHCLASIELAEVQQCNISSGVFVNRAHYADMCKLCGAIKQAKAFMHLIHVCFGACKRCRNNKQVLQISWQIKLKTMLLATSHGSRITCGYVHVCICA